MGFTIASQFLVFFGSKIDTFCWVGTPCTEKVQCFELFFSEERQKEKDILFCMVFLFWGDASHACARESCCFFLVKMCIKKARGKAVLWFYWGSESEHSEPEQRCMCTTTFTFLWYFFKRMAKLFSCGPSKEESVFSKLGCLVTFRCNLIKEPNQEG
jgi:hypothetical protein